MPLRERKIGYHQVLRKDGTVHSHQWLALPAPAAAGLSAEAVLARYLSFLRRCTLGLVRPHRDDTGIALRCLGQPLISFHRPVHHPADTTDRVDLPLNGGLLVRHDTPSRGELRFSISRGAGLARLEIRLSDYSPLLLGAPPPSRFRTWFYRVTQAAIHRVVTVRFLARLYEDLTNTHPPLSVVRTSLPDGEDI